MVPVWDDEHYKRFYYAQRIASICLSENFASLKKELEKIYESQGAGKSDLPLLAFQDALYALIAEDDPEFFKSLTAQGKG